MPKATITTATGAIVEIEGSQDEVRELLGVFATREPGASSAPPALLVQDRRNGRATPMSLLNAQIARGFFATPRELSAVKEALEVEGHFFPVTTLSPLMLRLVRRRDLRRIKDRKRWTYVR